jgi:hypothetical protein
MGGPGAGNRRRQATGTPAVPVQPPPLPRSCHVASGGLPMVYPHSNDGSRSATRRVLP